MEDPEDPFAGEVRLWEWAGRAILNLFLVYCNSVQLSSEKFTEGEKDLEAVGDRVWIVEVNLIGEDETKRGEERTAGGSDEQTGGADDHGGIDQNKKEGQHGELAGALFDSF